MKYLNLRKDYPLWDWTANANRIKSFNALINKENTANFLKKVWNELVDHLNSVLTEVGLEWDDKYLSLSSTKFVDIIIINWFPLPLTASMFNSVRYNIERVINVNWKWEYDPMYEGYVGRADYIGASTSNNPDTLYASAMLELVRRINVLINALKDADIIVSNSSNVANNSDYDASLEIPNLSKLVATAENYNEATGTISELDSVDFNTSEVSKTSSDARPELRDARDTLNVNIRCMTYYEAAMALEDLYRNLYSSVFCFTMVSAELAVNYHSVNARAEASSRFGDSIELSIANLSKMMAYCVNKDTPISSLVSAIPSGIETYEDLRSIFNIDLSANQKKALFTTLDLGAVVESEMESTKTFSMVCILGCICRPLLMAKTGVAVRGISNVNARARIASIGLTNTISAPIESIISNITHFNSNLIAPEAKHLNVEHVSEFTHDIEVGLSIPSYLVSKNRLRTIFDTELDAILIKVFDVSLINKARYENELIYCEEKIMASNEKSEFTFETGMELYSADNSMDVNALYEVTNDANIELLNYDDYLTTDLVNYSLFDANLENGNPYYLNINEVYHTTSNSHLENFDASQTMNIFEKAFEEEYQLSLSIVRNTAFDSSINSLAEINADLSFDPSSWLNPVQINEVLEVYQVYDSSLDGSNLELS